MSELSKSPVDMFAPDASGIIFEEINGITVPILQMSDTSGDYLAIPAMDKSLSDICGTFILGHLIKEINYDTYNGRIAVIKAYY